MAKARRRPVSGSGLSSTECRIFGTSPWPLCFITRQTPCGREPMGERNFPTWLRRFKVMGTGDEPRGSSFYMSSLRIGEWVSGSDRNQRSIETHTVVFLLHQVTDPE